MVRSFLIATAFAALFGAMAVRSAQADVQDKYPSRPLKIIVSLPAGSSADIRTRIIADQLTKMWGQQVVVENRPGGGGLIAVHALLSATADGHTLLVATGSTFTILPAQKENLPIDVNREDDVRTGRLGIIYSPIRNIDLSLTYERGDRRSTSALPGASLNDYNYNSWFGTVRFGF